MVGGDNVVDVAESSSRWVTASIEQLLIWNPDLIFGWKDNRGGYIEQIPTDPKWKDINAVKNGEIFGIPNQPYAWFATPPAANRLLGVKWLGHLLYPDIFTYDLWAEAREFYKLFYHYELTEQEFYEITEGCLRP